MTRQGLIDHADQIALPLRLLRERPAIRAGLQQRYRYVLVDELQDANTSQLELVLLLAGPDANVTVVGDPDQGIYDFRGASSGNVARFEAAHPGIRRVVLCRNYRSRAPIVEASHRLISHNAGDDLKNSQRPAKRVGRHDLPVSVRVYQSADDEADAVAASIAERVANGASPADFAVLVRSNAETSGIMRSLRVRGVPADNGVRPDLMQMAAVRSLLAFLRVVADPSNNLELYALATGEPYRLTAQQLGPQLNGSRRRSRSLWDTLVAALEDPAALEPATRGPLTLLVEHVRAGLERSARHTSGEVLHDYLRRSGTLGRLARLTEDGPDLNGLRGIARFVGLIRGRASLLGQDRVAFLVPHLERLSEQETQVDRDGPPDDQVAVLTAHRAKGLEFRVVYICGLVDGRFPGAEPRSVARAASRINCKCGAGRQAGRGATAVLRCHDQSARRALAELPPWRAGPAPAVAVHRRSRGHANGRSARPFRRRAVKRGADRTGPPTAACARDCAAIDRWPAVAQLFTGRRVPDLSRALPAALRRGPVDAGPPRACLRQRPAPGDRSIPRFAGPRRGTRRGRPAG